jgi:hypothetical protein
MILDISIFVMNDIDARHSRKAVIATVRNFD